jgi:hypothetical protein
MNQVCGSALSVLLSVGTWSRTTPMASASMVPDGEAEGDLAEEHPNWEALRRLSLEPGGFREKRVHIW